MGMQPTMWRRVLDGATGDTGTGDVRWRNGRYVMAERATGDGGTSDGGSRGEKFFRPYRPAIPSSPAIPSARPIPSSPRPSHRHGQSHPSVGPIGTGNAMGTVRIDHGNTITTIDAAPIGSRSLSSDDCIVHSVLTPDRMRGMPARRVEVTMKFLIIL